MDISIIVAFDNSAPLMENFIDQIMPFVEDRADRELVLVSDGCRNMATMEFSRACAAKWENVILVETPKKGGYSKANNAGVAASTGDYLLFANTDIFPEPDAIDLLRSKFDGNPKLGAAQGPPSRRDPEDLYAGRDQRHIPQGMPPLPLPRIRQDQEAFPLPGDRAGA